MTTDSFVFVGTLELITGLITFAVIFAVVNPRIHQRYDKLIIDKINMRSELMQELKTKLDDQFEEMLDFYTVLSFELYELEKDKNNYDRYYIVLPIIGLVFLIGYAFYLLSGISDYNFGLTLLILGAGTVTSSIHFIRHLFVINRADRPPIF